MIKVVLFFFLFMVFSCTSTPSKDQLKNEVLETERNFQKMTLEKGIAEAFYYYAAPDAAIKREGDSLIIGKENIKIYYSKKNLKNATVTWNPDFIDVSASGDMAYTYGKYCWKIKNDSGGIDEYKGVFHTVWKKQTDRNWKYVWD
jgi:ketosteroid isomerase-like protein